MKRTIRTSNKVPSSSEECVYEVDSSGACSSSVYSISLIHQYCSKLRQDELSNRKPRFFYFEDISGFVCRLILPSGVPIHEICSSPQPSMKAAKQDACLKAIKELHILGVLGDNLLPCRNDENQQGMYLENSPSNSCKGSARSLLTKICAANFWKPPLFMCCKEQGPSHSKLFTFKVDLKIEDGPAVSLECFGEPRMKKKAAAEHAAEGALWFLKQVYPSSPC